MKEETDLVTGEAVVLDLRVARLASRGAAMLLDVLIQAVTLLVVFLVLVMTSSGDESLLSAVMLVSTVLVLVGYPVLFETLSRGKTLGKMALGLRVVRADGGAIRFRQALTRGLCGALVDFWLLGFLGVVAILVSAFSRDGKRVGDYLAGTVVIRERVPVAADAAPVYMPPQLAHWASQLDLSGLPNDLALSIRQYLARYHDLRPEAAHMLGWSLAQQAGASVGAGIPQGIPVWAYLSAILAERRRRELARAGHAPEPMMMPSSAMPVPQTTYAHPDPATQTPTPAQAPTGQPPGTPPLTEQPPAAPTEEPPVAESPFAPPK
ncbi:RDD family protein [Amycolatopsis sp. NPDC059657]|uniref:RDD family protein n=1 Tax=Amycolatopsis sp. NPDC059657 TaxID=3346899 RepID=UPI003670332C